MSVAIWRIAVVWAALVMCCSGAAWAQEDISGTADSVKLKLPEKEELIVETVSEPEGTLVSVGGDALIEESQRLIGESRRVSELLEEASRDDNFFRQSWRDRALDALTDLDSVRRTIDIVQPPPRYADQFDLVLQAGEDFGVAVDVVQSAIEMDRQLYTDARKRLDSGELLALRGLEGLRRERVAELAERPAPVSDPFAAQQKIGALCSARVGRSEGLGYDRCVGAQAAAFDAIRNRHNFSELLDEQSFNRIRNRCLDEWPSDFVARDRCEQQGFDAARLR